jgi:hypothetical protein
MDLRKISFIAMDQIKDVQYGNQMAGFNVLSVEHWGLYYQRVIHMYLNHCCTAQMQ